MVNSKWGRSCRDLDVSYSDLFVRSIEWWWNFFLAAGFQEAFRIFPEWSLESPQKYLMMERSFRVHSAPVITN